MEPLLAFISATLGLALDAAPWLLLGLLLAGLLKAFLSEAWMVRWVGGESLGAGVRAALVVLVLLALAGLARRRRG
ncbi:hypothetical protein [Thiofaba sp. EF100]|uniref:hypothetical protein n=1 Tax=Thiofaba sp. EF100 TaxID=3121274 RepID=UPI003221DFD9